MNEVVIRAEKLGKLYHIGENFPYMTLREAITNIFASSFKKLKTGFKSKDKNPNYIWALKDVSFEIKKGEVVGFIGRNGAGKSTLLKIFSRITSPTEGCAQVHGRVASLLEVGTGFHPELTGRDNIYLNGAILGMKRLEIKRKFDEIVNFAEVEKFIYTPVKYYSSGMCVRLAFAVAAHLEPEILLVDEVLAVGDAAFQKKCLGKMGDVAGGGRTVLFVSHQMNQIRRLCERCIWIDGGKIEKMGTTIEVVSAYEAALTSVSLGAARESNNKHIAAYFLGWDIIEPRQEQTNVLATTGELKVRFMVRVNKPITNGNHGISLFNNDNQLIWGTCVSNLAMEPGIYEFIYELPALPLKPSVYFWRVSLYDDTGLLDVWDCIPELAVATKPVTHLSDEWTGVLNIPCKFYVHRSEQISSVRTI